MLEVKTKAQGHNAKVFSKKNKKDFRSKIRRFSSKFKRSPKKDLEKKFLEVFWHAPRRNNIAHELGPFSIGQEIVLSSSRGQSIFEDKQSSSQGQGLIIEAKDFKLCLSRRPLGLYLWLVPNYQP